MKGFTDEENKSLYYYGEFFVVFLSDFENHDSIDRFEGKVESARDLMSWYLEKLKI